MPQTDSLFTVDSRKEEEAKMIELVHLKAKVSKLESQLATADASSKHTKIEHDSQILSLEQQLQVQRLYYSQLLLNACGVTMQSY